MQIGVKGAAFQQRNLINRVESGMTKPQTSFQPTVDQVSIRFGNTNRLDAKQKALAGVFGLDASDPNLTVEKLRQGFVDRNWQLLAQVVVVTKEEPDREMALMRAIDLGETFLSELVNAIRPTCDATEARILNNETVMMFVAQSLDWEQDMQYQIDRPEYNRNAANKLGIMDTDPTPAQIVAAMQARQPGDLRQLFNLPA